MKPWETAYKILAGYAANSIIVAIPIQVAQAIAEATTPPDMPEEERKRRIVQAVSIGALIGAVPSFMLGNWVRGQAGWRATGLTQMSLAGITALVGLLGLILAEHISERIPAPLRYGYLIASPLTPLTKQVGTSLVTARK